MHLFRDAVRAKEIVSVLLKYRFDELLKKFDMPGRWLTRLAPSVRTNAPMWERVRMAVEELGPTFVKTAQVLSTRPDILPSDLIHALKGLRSQVTPRPFEELRPQIEGVLGQPVEAVFSDFNTTPVASGSLGQIYKARLRSNGDWVAVKIQRPGIRKPVSTDLEIIAWFAAQMHQHLPTLRPFDLPTVVDELKIGMMKELDFAVEARHSTLFAALNQDPEKVFAPRVYPEFTDEVLLVTEWIDGVPPDEIPHLPPETAKRIARNGGDSFFHQIVVSGFFHGDPHPGNVFIVENERICFIDWGLAGQLTREMRHHVIDLFSACQEGDAERVSHIAVQMGRSTRRIDHNLLEKAVTATLFKHAESLRKMENLGQLIFELIFVFGSNGIHITRDYTLLARAVISIEETAKALDPSFNLAEVGRPYIRKLTMERWNPFKWSRHLASQAHEKLAIIADLPNDVQRILHRIEDEDIGIQLKLTGLERSSDTIHAAFSRISLAIIIASLIVGSSIVITTGVPPILWGYPAIGILGYVLSGLMGLRVAWDIFRSGHSTKKAEAKKREKKREEEAIRSQYP